MTQFKIEKGVPAPTDGRNGKAKYPWREMEVGDSFFIPGITSTVLGGSIANARRRTGFEFVSRNEGGGVRVWRVK